MSKPENRKFRKNRKNLKIREIEFVNTFTQSFILIKTKTLNMSHYTSTTFATISVQIDEFGTKMRVKIDPTKDSNTISKNLISSIDNNLIKQTTQGPVTILSLRMKNSYGHTIQTFQFQFNIINSVTEDIVLGETAMNNSAFKYLVYKDVSTRFH